MPTVSLRLFVLRLVVVHPPIIGPSVGQKSNDQDLAGIQPVSLLCMHKKGGVFRDTTA